MLSGESATKDDGAGRVSRGQLHRAKAGVARKIGVQPPSEPHIKRLGSIRIGYRQDDHFELNFELNFEVEVEVEGWVTLYQSVAVVEMARASGDVERQTRRPPASFVEFLAAHPDSCTNLGRR